MHDHGVEQSALRAISLASYAHAQNESARRHVRTTARRSDVRRIALDRRAVPSVRLLPGERRRRGDGAGVGRTRERFRSPPLLPVVRSRGQPLSRRPRRCTTRPTTRHRRSRRWRRACSRWRRSSPTDIDVLQSYENFTGGVLMSIVEHGFCAPDEVNEFFQTENLLAPNGTLPLNTSGGNLAECYMHGLGLNIEAVRQIWGQSTNQVKGAEAVDGDLRADGDAGQRLHLRCGAATLWHASVSEARARRTGRGARRARRAVLARHARREAAAAALRLVPALAMGTGVDLPSLPQFRPAIRSRPRRAASSTATNASGIRCIRR